MSGVDPTWDADKHLPRVLQRGRQLRRRGRRSFGLGGAVLLVLLTVALGSQMQSNGSRELRTAGGPVGSALPALAPTSNEASTTSVPPVEETTMPVTTSTSNPPPRGTAVASPGPIATGDPVQPGKPSPATTAPPPSTVPPSPEPVTVTVTQADGNAGYALRPGDRLVVVLTPGNYYSEPSSSNEAVLHRTAGSMSPDGSAQASFIAAASGQATVRYAVDPKCSRSKPSCGIASWAVFVAVTVTGGA